MEPGRLTVIRCVVVFTTFVTVLSGSVALATLSAHGQASDATATGGPPTPAGAAPTGGVPVAGSDVQGPALRSPHPGTLKVYEVAPGGATTEDPAVAYDTVSAEPIENVYETLVTFNGSSNSTESPVLATCVPGTVQCVTDYGSTMVYQADGASYTGAAGTAPVYWSFAIDPTARFYNPSTHVSWGVYPTDVMFSEARELAWSEVIGVGSTAGWLTAQALLANGSEKWDGGLHAPYNTTPGNILGSMLINDSAYCPAAALADAHGCITFDAVGGGGVWPSFLQLVADPYAGAVVPCGWYTAEGAGLPGWSGSQAKDGDGPCDVTQLGADQSTSDATWTSYLNTLQTTGAESWDGYEEEIASTYPAPDPKVQWTTVGSGPYDVAYSPTTSPPGYTLTASPGYTEPSGCSGGGDLARYAGPGCYPAAGKYQEHVDVYYEPSDSVGISEYRAGQADFAEIESTDLPSMLKLTAEAKLNYYLGSSLAPYFFSFNLNWSRVSYDADYLPSPPPNIPADFFSGQAARSLLIAAYPYNGSLRADWTVDGIPYLNGTGGPILREMADYPGNVTFPDEQNSGSGAGNPSSNASVVGSAAWWWVQGTNASSPYYDPELAACTPGSPCTFDLFGALGDPGLSESINGWIAEIDSITGGALRPSQIACYGDVCGQQFFPTPPIGPGTNPATVWSLGWAADTYDPQDMMVPFTPPNTTFTYVDAVEQQLNLPAYHNIAACGHSAPSYADLVYWSHQAELTSACEGIAYDTANFWDQVATHATPTATRALEYDLVSKILNALGLYVWYGVGNQVYTAAPWISGASIDRSPLFGGQGDQLWFDIRYQTGESVVTFSEKGLPAGLTWGVTADGLSRTNTSVASGRTTAGVVGFEQPNGTIGFAITAPKGYGVAKIAGPDRPTYSSATVHGETTITVDFGQLIPLTFVESVSGKWPGLASGTTWGVTLTPAASNYGSANSTTGTAGVESASVTLMEPQGSVFKFVVSKPSDYVADPSDGTVKLPASALSVTRTERFKLLGGDVALAERRSPSHTTWSAEGAQGPALAGSAVLERTLLDPPALVRWGPGGRT